MKRTLPFLFGFLCFPPAFTYAQAGRNLDAVQVETKQVQGTIYMLVGAGSNVTVQVGAEGVLLVDTQFAPMAPKILAAVRKLSDKPIRYIINTHVHSSKTCSRDDQQRDDPETGAGRKTYLGLRTLIRRHDRFGSNRQLYRRPI